MRTIKMFAVAILLCVTSQSYADNNTAKNNSSATATKTEKSLSRMEAQKLVNRLKEIHTLAKTETLTLDQKSRYKKEVNDIKEQIEKMDGFYVYLSLTAILIIILILILI